MTDFNRSLNELLDAAIAAERWFSRDFSYGNTGVPLKQLQYAISKIRDSNAEAVCPYVVTSNEGSSFCRLAEQNGSATTRGSYCARPQSDKVEEIQPSGYTVLPARIHEADEPGPQVGGGNWEQLFQRGIPVLESDPRQIIMSKFMEDFPDITLPVLGQILDVVKPYLAQSEIVKPVQLTSEYLKGLQADPKVHDAILNPADPFSAAWHKREEDHRSALKRATMREIVDVKPGTLPINIDEALEALHTQYQFCGDAIIARRSPDAPTDQQLGRIRGAHLNIIPILRALKAAWAKLEEQGRRGTDD